MPPTLETERLILQPLELADAEQVQEIFPDWEVVKFLNSRIPWPFPEDGAHRYYRDDAIPAMERGDEWHWTLCLKDEPARIVGAIGLFRNNGQNNRGFWLVPRLHGNGIMTEIVIAVTDYWFHVLGFPKLYAHKAVANVASRRISERMGMRVIETRESDYVSGTHLTEVWEITADEWREWRSVHPEV